jgi:hypothetical protein
MLDVTSGKICGFKSNDLLFIPECSGSLLSVSTGGLPGEVIGGITQRNSDFSPQCLYSSWRAKVTLMILSHSVAEPTALPPSVLKEEEKENHSGFLLHTNYWITVFPFRSRRVCALKGCISCRLTCRQHPSWTHCYCPHSWPRSDANPTSTIPSSFSHTTIRDCCWTVQPWN